MNSFFYALRAWKRLPPSSFPHLYPWGKKKIRPLSRIFSSSGINGNVISKSTPFHQKKWFCEPLYFWSIEQRVIV